ncbi:hypothetical protein PG996_012014 [Apiospora saccharicola]|uniref:Ubiquitin-like domain-containing protein n=1 Tax=Apiospora saccharicola TaxID=335842 RepID=A0ABR1U417_9PEZI
MGPLPPPTSSSPITLTIMENSVDAGLTFHRLLTTEEGWAGVGSYDVAPGVAMAILFGCSVPMVLRPLAPARYQVLGEAYIHGIISALFQLCKMSFSPTFGSFGDFISLSILIKDIVIAVGDTHGSAADYRSLSAALDNMDAMLNQAHLLCNTHSTNSNIQTLQGIANHAIDSCRADLTLFLTCLRDYKSSLGDGHGNIFKKTSRKLLWLFKKGEIDTFHVKLIGHSASLNMMMGMVTSQMVNANEEARRNDAAALRRSGNIVLQSIQALGDVLLNGVKQIIQLNMFIHRDLQVSLLKLESRIETPISVEAFTFEDAIGRVAVMHLSSVDSWEAFDALLMVHFNGRRGFGRVTRKRYALQDVRRKREIRRSVPWRSAMLPGSQVSMSIICNLPPLFQDAA